MLGLGAIGRRVLTRLQKKWLPDASYAVLERQQGAALRAEGICFEQFSTVQELLEWQPTLAVECAGHEVVASVVPTLLRNGVDVVVVSIGALADVALRDTLDRAACEGGARLLTVSGAIGGLDALEAARSAGIESVVYTGRKPPAAWSGTQAEAQFRLSDLVAPTVIFTGSAADSARLYPKNANVTAAVALAGVGFDHTEVQLIADPGVTQNVHELDVRGAFGRFSIRLENRPLPDNPKTSWLAALSIEATVCRHLQIPTDREHA